MTNTSETPSSSRTSCSERTAFSAVFVAVGSRISAMSRRPFHAAAIWSASVGPPSTDQPVKMTPLVRTSSASDSARRTPARQIVVMPCDPSAPMSR